MVSVKYKSSRQGARADSPPSPPGIHPLSCDLSYARNNISRMGHLRAVVGPTLGIGGVPYAECTRFHYYPVPVDPCCDERPSLFGYLTRYYCVEMESTQEVTLCGDCNAVRGI